MLTTICLYVKINTDWVYWVKHLITKAEEYIFPSNLAGSCPPSSTQQTSTQYSCIVLTLQGLCLTQIWKWPPGCPHTESFNAPGLLQRWASAHDWALWRSLQPSMVGNFGTQDTDYFSIWIPSINSFPVSTLVRQCHYAGLLVLYFRLHVLEPDTTVVLSVRLYQPFGTSY